MKKIPKFNFLPDKPLDGNSESFFDFYHKAIAPALIKILKADSSPHTIGIFGSWGTGKSTIINMLRDDKNLKTPIFVFDAWKYQEDALRRTFLIKFVDFLQDEVGISIENGFLNDIYTATELRSNLLDKKEGLLKRILKTAKKNVLLSLLVFTVLVGGVAVFFFPQYPFLKKLSDAIAYLSSFTIIGFATSTIAKAVFERVAEVILQNSSKASTSIMEVSRRDRLNSPEEF